MRTALLLTALAAAPSCIAPISRGIEPAEIRVFQNREYSQGERAYVLSAHNPSYFLASYNSKFNPTVYAGLGGDAVLQAQKEEAKFQFSMKAPVWQNVFSDHTDLFLGYTQQSYWQVFSDSEALSRPFRETNYEPEIFFRRYANAELPWGGTLVGLDLAINHQSNGQTLELSRSWNRLMVRAAADYGKLAILGRAWYRLPESDADDENPNEYRYLGYGDVRAIWEEGRQTFSAMVRPSTESASFEVTWSVPVADQLRFYVQWYNGYAENLFEYTERSNRFGIGIAVTDWLVGSQ